LLAVETLDLSKTYGKTDALRGLNFTVNEGEVMASLDSSRLRGKP
jgi:ABC-type multidrug transport system ATPase subunit